MNFSLVIPVYNNSSSIKELYSGIQFCFNNFNKDLNNKLEIIFVDDCSSDSSIKEIESLNSDQFIKLKIISLNLNHGQGHATIIGLRNALYEKVIVLSADLQDDPKYLLEFFNKLSKGSNLVIGIKKKISENFFKKISSYIYHTLVRIDYKYYPQYGFDFYGMDRKILDKFLLIDNYFLSSADLIKIEKNYDFFFYKKNKRIYGESQYTFYSRLELGISQIISSTRWPARLAMILGYFIFVISLFSIIFIIVDFFYNNRPIIGWRSTIVVITFFFGLTFLVLGLIVEYLYRILIILRKPNFSSIKYIKNI